MVEIPKKASAIKDIKGGMSIKATYKNT